MHKKEQVLTTEITITIAILAAVLTLAITATTTADFVSAQDLNPPTTGKTSQNVTSTFGPNMPTATTSSSSATSNTTSHGSNMTSSGIIISK
jgi:hypothetical protein